MQLGQDFLQNPLHIAMLQLIILAHSCKKGHKEPFSRVLEYKARLSWSLLNSFLWIICTLCQSQFFCAFGLFCCNNAS